MDPPFGLPGKPGYAVCGDSLVELIEKMETPKTKRIKVIDMCSGAGGPVPKIAQMIHEKRRFNQTKLEFLMTDLFPNVKAIQKYEKNPFAMYEPSSVDACKLPTKFAQGTVIRTSYGSFHHLPETVATQIFKDVVEQGHGLMIVEATGRRLAPILGLFLFMPLMTVIAFLFLIRPITLFRTLWFIFPVLPFLIVVDGTLSNLRTYEEGDYNRIIDSIPGARDQFEWKFTRKRVIFFEDRWLGYTSIGRRVGIFLSELAFEASVLTGTPKQ